jgi:biopolymer transport protein ExbD
MAIIRKRQIKGEAEIPTASMSDIAFLLIVFFMTTTIFSRDKGLKLVLPEKGSEKKVASGNIVKVSINDAGEIFVGDEPVTLSLIQPKVREKLVENPKRTVIIKTHYLAPYEKMIQVFDEVKGIEEAKSVALGTIRPEGG